MGGETQVPCTEIGGLCVFGGFLNFVLFLFDQFAHFSVVCFPNFSDHHENVGQLLPRN